MCLLHPSVGGPDGLPCTIVLSRTPALLKQHLSNQRLCAHNRRWLGHNRHRLGQHSGCQVKRGGAFPAARNLGNYPGTTGNIVVHTHMCFLYNVYLCAPLFPYFCYYFYLFGPLTPTTWCICSLSPIWNGPCINFESSPLWALQRRQGLGSTWTVANPDPTPRGGGGLALRTPKQFYETMGFVGAGGNLLNSAKGNLWGPVRVL